MSPHGCLVRGTVQMKKFKLLSRVIVIVRLYPPSFPFRFVVVIIIVVDRPREAKEACIPSTTKGLRSVCLSEPKSERIAMATPSMRTGLRREREEEKEKRKGGKGVREEQE